MLVKVPNPLKSARAFSPLNLHIPARVRTLNARGSCVAQGTEAG